MLEWVGGPLDGTYVGADKVREAWRKFTKGNTHLKVSADKVAESANPKCRWTILFAKDGRARQSDWTEDHCRGGTIAQCPSVHRIVVTPARKIIFKLSLKP